MGHCDIAREADGDGRDGEQPVSGHREPRRPDLRLLASLSPPAPSVRLDCLGGTWGALSIAPPSPCCAQLLCPETLSTAPHPKAEVRPTAKTSYWFIGRKQPRVALSGFFFMFLHDLEKGPG